MHYSLLYLLALTLFTNCRELEFSETDFHYYAILFVRAGVERTLAPVDHLRSRHLDTSLDRYATPHCKEFELYHC